jgi:hypothetical protein
MKKIHLLLLLAFLMVSTLISAQQKSRVYKTPPPGIGKDAEAIVIFMLLSPEDAKAKGVSLKGAEKYNDYLKKHAAIYKGKKEFMTMDEVKSIDFSKPNDYKYMVQIVSIKGTEGNRWPYIFGTLHIESGITYIANTIYSSNHSSELKKEIKFIEKARKKNAGK